jgi:hypothetical protein
VIRLRLVQARRSLLTALEDVALWWLRRQRFDLATIGYRWGAYAVVAWGPEDVQERREGLTTEQAREFLWHNEGPIAQAMEEAGAEQMYHQLEVADLPDPEVEPVVAG